MRLQRARHNLVTKHHQYNTGGLREKAQVKFLAWWLMSCKHSNNLIPMLLLIILKTKTRLLLWGFPGGSDSKESTCNAADLGSIPGLGRFPVEEMATHSSILAWRILWTKEPGGLLSMGSQRVGHDWVTNTFAFAYTSFLYRLVQILKMKNLRDKPRLL